MRLYKQSTKINWLDKSKKPYYPKLFAVRQKNISDKQLLIRQSFDCNTKSPSQGELLSWISMNSRLFSSQSTTTFHSYFLLPDTFRSFQGKSSCYCKLSLTIWCIWSSLLATLTCKKAWPNCNGLNSCLSYEHVKF